jgi:C1A family cysteine protease
MGAVLCLAWGYLTRLCTAGRTGPTYTAAKEECPVEPPPPCRSSEDSCTSGGVLRSYNMLQTTLHDQLNNHNYERWCTTPHRGHTTKSHYPCAAPSIPAQLDLRGLLLEPRDQGEQSSCFAFAACAMREWQEAKETKMKRYMSPQFLYNNRYNLTDDDPMNDEGMYGVDVMKLMAKVGVVLEELYPYGKNVGQHPDDIPLALFAKAKKVVVSKYATVETIEGLKLALVNNGPCLICFPVYNEVLPQMWRKGSLSDPLLGGHAMTVVGYNDKGFIIRNSWGKGWNGGGHVRLDYAEWGNQWEVWTTIDAKDII